MTVARTFTIAADRTFNLTYYKPGINFSGAYVEFEAWYSVSGNGPSGTLAARYTTSGGQITILGTSGIVVKGLPTAAYPSGTSGLPVGVGQFEMFTYMNSGEDVDSRIAGEFCAVRYAGWKT